MNWCVSLERTKLNTVWETIHSLTVPFLVFSVLFPERHHKAKTIFTLDTPPDFTTKRSSVKIFKIVDHTYKQGFLYLHENLKAKTITDLELQELTCLL